MMTGRELDTLFLSFANPIDHQGKSRWYLPFLLYAKWEYDNGKESAIDFSGKIRTIIHDLQCRYPIPSAVIPENTSEASPNPEQPIPDKSVIRTPPLPGMLYYAITTLKRVDFSENNVPREELSAAFNRYLNVMDHAEENFPVEETVTRFAEEVIGLIAGRVKEAYDPFCSYGNALKAVDAEHSSGADADESKCMAAKIRFNFMDRSSSFTATDSFTSPVTNDDGTLRKYPFVITCLSHELMRKTLPVEEIAAADKFQRFTGTLHGRGTIREHPGITGLVLGHTLAVSSEICILYYQGFMRERDIFRDMSEEQIRSFLSSDILESVIRIYDSSDKWITGEPVSIIYRFNRKKKHNGEVLYVNCDLNDMDAKSIAEIIQNAENVPHIARLIPVDVLMEDSITRMSALYYANLSDERIPKN